MMAYFPSSKPDTKSVNETIEKSILELEEKIKKLKIYVVCDHEWEMEVRIVRGAPTTDRIETWSCKKCNYQKQR